MRALAMLRPNGCQCVLETQPHSHLHALGWVCQHQLSTEGAQQDAALQTHAGGHGQHQLVATSSSNESKANACVATGGLNKGGLDEAGGRR